MSSVHKECGADIVWARREDDEERFMPPMEYAGEVFILEGKGRDRVAKRTHSYKAHLCDPDKIIEWQDYKRRLAEAQGVVYEGVSDYAAAREQQNEETWRMALMVSCPRCSATEGEKCHSLQVHLIKKGIHEDTRNPHPERLEAFHTWQQAKTALEVEE